MKRCVFFLFVLWAMCASAFRTDTVNVATANMPAPVPVIVISPDATGAQRFPSVYLLHGYGGDEGSWTKIRPDLGKLADRYGMVLVMPGMGDTWYVDSEVAPQFRAASFIVKDLVPYIDSHYPTVAERGKRAVSGLSMGGHGAFYLGRKYPEVFGSVGSTSGGVDIRPFPTRWKMAEVLGPYQGNEARWDEASAAANVDRIAAADLNIIFDCGSSDFFADVNDKLHRDLLAAGVKHDFISRPGTHNMAYWNNSVLYTLLFFNECFK